MSRDMRDSPLHVTSRRTANQDSVMEALGLAQPGNYGPGQDMRAARRVLPRGGPLKAGGRTRETGRAVSRVRP